VAKRPSSRARILAASSTACAQRGAAGAHEALHGRRRVVAIRVRRPEQAHRVVLDMARHRDAAHERLHLDHPLPAHDGRDLGLVTGRRPVEDGVQVLARREGHVELEEEPVELRLGQGVEVVGEVTAKQSGSVGFVGFGIGRKGSLWVAHKGRQTPATHICFRAPTRAAVRDFHAAALDAGAKDNGGPGVRPEYHDAYYAAFVLSPEGHNIEAVCFEGES
jgi:hypothetical protein